MTKKINREPNVKFVRFGWKPRRNCYEWTWTYLLDDFQWLHHSVISAIIGLSFHCACYFLAIAINRLQWKIHSHFPGSIIERFWAPFILFILYRVKHFERVKWVNFLSARMNREYFLWDRFMRTLSMMILWMVQKGVATRWKKFLRNF